MAHDDPHPTTDHDDTNRADDSPAPSERGEAPLTVVGIGASAGGLSALKVFFDAMPDNPGVPFVVVMHLSPEHESHLADLLQPHCPMPVQQVASTVALEPNHVYVIPPGANLNTIDTHLRLSDLEPQRRNRAPIDHFFRTLASTHDGDAIGIVLTGTGSDGTLGLRRIKEAGGLTVVQNPDEADFDGMPRSAIVSGMVDLILPLREIPKQILRFARMRPRVLIPEKDEEIQEDQARLLQNIFAQVHSRTGHDFSQYKRSTIMRRIQRRMQIRQKQTLIAYLELLREHQDEAVDLFNDLLITVTEFFRDRKVYDRLEQTVIPKLFDAKSSNDRLRVWSVGCSTGEEAYSLAMQLMEEAGRRDAHPTLQIFASDLHERNLISAREGIYPEEIAADVSPERLARFFIHENGHYRIRREVRELVVFAVHNLLHDPPFSHMDLIVCRNVLIYMQRDIQQDVIALFHYALEPQGLLLLGTSETVDRNELFHCEDKDACVFRKRNVPSREPRFPTFPLVSGGRRAPGRPAPPQHHAEAAPSYRALHERMLERYGPPSVLVNAENEVVHYSVRAARYMQIPGGDPTASVFKLVCEPLRTELRAAMYCARDGDKPTRSKPLTISIDGVPQQVIVRVQPATEVDLNGFFLIIFDEQITPAPADEAQQAEATTSSATIRELEAEIDLSRRRLQTEIEKYEAGCEQMQASNEELQSSNEELRSTLEELETSKEELQSMNEELATVNQENRHRVEELAQLSSDLQNLLASTDIATLFLDRDMRIVRFTPKVAELFNIRNSDRGRPLSDLTHHLGYPQLQDDARRVLRRLTPVECEVAGEPDHWFLARLLPYRATDDRIEGVVITLIDITERKNAELALRRSEAFHRLAVDAGQIGTWEIDVDSGDRYISGQLAELMGYVQQPAEPGAPWHHHVPGDQWMASVHPADRAATEAAIAGCVEHDKPLEIEFRIQLRDGTVRWLYSKGKLARSEPGEPRRLCGASIDITRRKADEQSLREARDELEQRVAERTAALEQLNVRQRGLARELANTELRERKRLANILHDDLQQQLVAAKLHMETVRRRIADKALAEDISAACDALNEARKVSRTLTRQLCLPVLYEQGLVPALHWLAEDVAGRFKFELSVTAPDQEIPTDEHIKATVFEAIRELVFNAVKHSGVDRATLNLRLEGDRVILRIEDDGAGFDVHDVSDWNHENTSGMGLFSISERMGAIGGSMHIDSAPDAGTRVILQAPLR